MESGALLTVSKCITCPFYLKHTPLALRQSFLCSRRFAALVSLVSLCFKKMQESLCELENLTCQNRLFFW